LAFVVNALLGYLFLPIPDTSASPNVTLQGNNVTAVSDYIFPNATNDSIQAQANATLAQANGANITSTPEVPMAPGEAERRANREAIENTRRAVLTAEG
jgi:hypothetical protein